MFWPKVTSCKCHNSNIREKNNKIPIIPQSHFVSKIKVYFQVFHNGMDDNCHWFKLKFLNCQNKIIR